MRNVKVELELQSSRLLRLWRLWILSFIIHLCSLRRGSYAIREYGNRKCCLFCTNKIESEWARARMLNINIFPPSERLDQDEINVGTRVVCTYRKRIEQLWQLKFRSYKIKIGNIIFWVNLLHSIIVTIATIVSTAVATATSAAAISATTRAWAILRYDTTKLVALITKVLLHHNVAAVQLIAVHLIQCDLNKFGLLELNDATASRFATFVVKELNECNITNFTTKQILNILPTRLERDTGWRMNRKMIENALQLNDKHLNELSKNKMIRHLSSSKSTYLET